MKQTSITGGCYCGAVRFRAAQAPIYQTNCHCANCRRAVGAQAVAWITVNRINFRFDQGTPRRYRTDTGAWRTFCDRCGTSLTYERDTRPDEIDITTGSLDHPQDFPPIKDFYTQEKLPWVALIDSAASVISSVVNEGPRPVEQALGGSPGRLSARDQFLGYIKAYNSKDVAAMLAFFDDACVFENVSGGKVTVRTQGKAELEALARKAAQAFASREQRVVSLTEGRGRIVAEIDYHAVLQADLSAELKAGSRLDLRGISVCEFAQGKIVRLSDYS